MFAEKAGIDRITRRARRPGPIGPDDRRFPSQPENRFMKALLGFFGGIIFAGAGLLFATLAMANFQQTSWGYGWMVFVGFYVIGLAIAMTAPTSLDGGRRLLVGTGALLCGSALLILVISRAGTTMGAVGIIGGMNIAILLVIGLAMLAGGLFPGKTR
jgi:hypothetical protein